MSFLRSFVWQEDATLRSGRLLSCEYGAAGMLEALLCSPWANLYHGARRMPIRRQLDRSAKFGSRTLWSDHFGFCLMRHGRPLSAGRLRGVGLVSDTEVAA